MKLAYTYLKENTSTLNKFALLLGDKQCGYASQVGRLKVHGFKYLSRGS